MDVIGQLQPNKKVRFVPVTMEEALAARREEAGALARLRDTLS
jgi:allophanate hydrolase